LNHNKMKNKKIILITISLFFIASILTGAKLFDVELKGADDPLVDLGAVIECGGSFIPSADDAQNEEYSEEDTASPVDATEESDDNQNNDSIADAEHVEKIITIRISNNKIYINNATYTLSSYINCILSLSKSADAIVLQDDYAEYHTYCEVRNFLNENGINYTEESI